MPLTAPPIDEADEAGQGARRQEPGDKDEEAIDEAGHDDLSSVERGDVCDASGILGRHTRIPALFANSRSGAEFRLRDAGTEDSDGHARSLEFAVQRLRKGQQKRFRGCIDGLKGNGRERIDRGHVQDPAAPAPERELAKSAGIRV